MSFLEGCPGQCASSELRVYRSGTPFAETKQKMDSWDTDSEDLCDWGDSSDEASSSEQEELIDKYNKE